jgi:hypothetical protein
VDSAGNVYLAVTSIQQDRYVDRVRRIDTNGIVTTAAGGGTGGDGVPATSASIEATGIGVDAQGNLLIVSRNQGRVHQVGPDGLLRTVAGGGTGGDGGPATSATLLWPTNVAVDAAGNLLISAADANANFNVGVVRKVSAS